MKTRDASPPWVLQPSIGANYPARPSVFFPCIYYGWDEPTDLNTDAPHFSEAAGDDWFRRNP